MGRHPSCAAIPRAQLAAERLFSAFERFLHVEAVSGAVLLAAAAAALAWANSPAAGSYHDFWHAPLAIGVGGYAISEPLHFWINDALMTVFFLVVGMEVRREIHEGALASLRLALLPLAAAAGGVIVPALIYLALNSEAAVRPGWAVPTATDIAFAIGVLALLGRSIPSGVRVFLLALAIIDDLAAVLIIALFYSGDLEPTGLFITGIGVLLVLGFQRIGIGAAYAYVLPGALLWAGLLETGAHPTLAGVALGLMTPVRPIRSRERPADLATRALAEFNLQAREGKHDPRLLMAPLKRLRHAQRELLPPVVRVQAVLHPWVAYGIMPLFALANAGVGLDGADPGGEGAQRVMLGVFLALALGKPLGIVLASWLAVRLGVCRLPPGVGWRGLWLVGCLGGIGFTMSIFLATLAFEDPSLLSSAKTGVLVASAVTGCVGLALGYFGFHRPQRASHAQGPTRALAAAHGTNKGSIRGPR